MTKPTRSSRASASLSVRLAVPLIVTAIAASCSSGSPDAVSTSSGGSAATGSVATTSSSASGTGGAGGASSTTSASGTGGTGNVDQSCTSDADCAADPQKHHVCDTSTGDCVGCLPANDMCPQGQYCEPATNACAVGCTDATDCNMGGAANLICDTTSHVCVGCLSDANCPAGTICAPNQIRVLGCSPTHDCQAGSSCCGDTCYDLQTNLGHCGDCSTKCQKPPNAQAVCIAGQCAMGNCTGAYADCNGNKNDGCEWNVLQDGPCVCSPGSTQSCYYGAPGTAGVGPCAAGTQTCDATGTVWGPCEGQVLPSAEVCANSVDDDCNGAVDDVADTDGDGWTACNGDCCETPGPNCGNPKLVNPGAFEVLNNGIDDDCDAATLDTVPVPPCSTAENFAGVTALAVAQAMDICQTTTANAPLAQKKWGLITSAQLLANGSQPNAAALTDIQNKQTAILVDYGSGGVLPHKGPTFAGISSGIMRDQDDASYVNPNGGTALTTTSTPPGSYLAAHANALPSSAGCSGMCVSGSGANDSVNIRLSIRTPTNAKSFSYDFRFFSAEYQTFQCTQFNDFYLALLQTSALGLPADKNISFDSLKNPISVNNGFFEVCVPKGCNLCPGGAGELAGTGMQLNNTGGATAWLTTDAPIVPGETIQLELMIFDVSDHLLDSIALLDNFRWNLQASQVGTHK